jgi:hypothetical protein
MDCVDCHNRPSHKYYPPAVEVDRALRDGLIDRSLPFVKREGVRILDAEYPSHEEARTAISSELTSYYAENYPELASSKAETINAAANALGDLYSVNVFPQMQVWWNTYPEHIGHQNSDGCFRCHGRRLRTEDREMIPQDCGTCHTLLAEKEEAPEILTLLEP